MTILARVGASAVTLVLGLALVFPSGAFVAGSAAAEGTGWKGNDKSQLRLLAAPAAWRGKRQLFAGIEIRLAPKWKTYWRTPGDTGIPPDFDWSGSENLAKAEVLYPVPVRFKDPTGSSIGYEAGVTLPVRVTAKDPSQPVTLRLNANYAICYDLCVPVEAQQMLRIDRGWQQGDLQRDTPIIEMALADVPVPMPVPGDDAGVGDAIGVTKIVKKEGADPALEFFVKVKGAPAQVDLFIEGPDGLYVPTPQRKATSSNMGEGDVVFTVDLRQVDEPARFNDIKLTCTLSAGDQAIVQPCIVD